MKNVFKLATALACLSSTISHSMPLALTCKTQIDDRSLISRLAPNIASRIDPHHLKIRTSKGDVSFVDIPPHDEPLSGVHYHFCDRRGGFVLVVMEDEALFTGRLINEGTGKVTGAGQEVLLSEDRRAYFATEQPDGLDGEEWSIYAIGGNRSWKGYSFIAQQGNPQKIYAYLDQPQWLTNGEFSARASCASNVDVKWSVKLVKDKDLGEWLWRPQKKCQ